VGAALGVCAAGVLTLIASGGGGGDGASLYPLWVETDIVIRDLDGDGRADVLTLAQLAESLTRREGRLTVYRQTGGGGFAAPEAYRVGEYPWHLDVGDIDGDGAPDLVIADVGTESVWMLLQDPDSPGHFLAPEELASGLHGYGAAIADLNADGAPDIAVGDEIQGAARLVLLYQDPAAPGVFGAPVDFGMPGAVSLVAAGDLAGDDRTDLLAWVYTPRTGYTPNGLFAVVAQDDGGPGPVSTLAPQSGLNAARLVIADYDGDARDDLFAFFTPFSADYAAKLTVLLQGTVPGVYAAPADTSLAGVRGIDDAAFADLNGDGRPDAAVVGFYPVGSPTTVESRLNIFAQSGAGYFAPTAIHQLPLTASRVAAGDIDGDGRNDLVVLGGDNQCFRLIQSHAAPGVFMDAEPLR
jgi:hypothetical protein